MYLQKTNLLLFVKLISNTAVIKRKSYLGGARKGGWNK